MLMIVISKILRLIKMMKIMLKKITKIVVAN